MLDPGIFCVPGGRTSDLLGLTPSARERFIGASRARKILPLAGSNPVSRTSMESSDGKSGDFFVLSPENLKPLFSG